MSDHLLSTVKGVNAEPGFGFIWPDEGGKNAFVHFSAIAGNDFRPLDEGQKVEFTVQDGPKFPSAANVTGH